MGAGCGKWQCCSNENTIDNSNMAKRLNRVDESSSDDNSPLIITSAITVDGFKDAIKNGNDSLVMAFVAQNPTLNLADIHFENGDNCLHVAVRKKYHNLIYYLLTHGVSPNTQNRLTNETPLHTAVRIRDCKIVSLLGEFDADPNVDNKKHETPIQIAHSYNDKDILDILAPDTMKMIRSITNVRSMKSSNRLQLDELNAITSDFLNPSVTSRQKHKVNLMHGYSIVDRRSIEQKLDAKDQKKLNQLRVDSLNPSIYRFNLKDRTRTTVAVLHQINEITQKKIKLPQLVGWIEKKKDKPPYFWRKRWVVVKENYILWSDKKRTIERVRSSKERNKWNNYLNLMSIKSVEPILTSKSKNKFVINSAKTRYMFKCANEKERDHWIKGLRQHKHHIESILNYLGTKTKNIP